MIETDFKCAELHLFNDDMSLCLFHRKFHMDKLRKQMNQQAFWYLLKTTFNQKKYIHVLFWISVEKRFRVFPPLQRWKFFNFLIGSLENTLSFVFDIGQISKCTWSL